MMARIDGHQRTKNGQARIKGLLFMTVDTDHLLQYGPESESDMQFCCEITRLTFGNPL